MCPLVVRLLCYEAIKDLSCLTRWGSAGCWELRQTRCANCKIFQTRIIRGNFLHYLGAYNSSWVVNSYYDSHITTAVAAICRHAQLAGLASVQIIWYDRRSAVFLFRIILLLLLLLLFFLFDSLVAGILQLAVFQLLGKSFCLFVQFLCRPSELILRQQRCCVSDQMNCGPFQSSGQVCGWCPPWRPFPSLPFRSLPAWRNPVRNWFRPLCWNLSDRQAKQ